MVKSTEDMIEVSLEYCAVYSSIGFRLFSVLFLKKCLSPFNVNLKC